MKTPDIAILSATLAHRAPHIAAHISAHTAAAIATAGKRAASLATRYCNGTIRPDEYEKRHATIAANASALLEPYGLSATATGDPRGHCLHLFALPGAAPLRGNTWGGDESGYGV